MPKKPTNFKFQYHLLVKVSGQPGTGQCVVRANSDEEFIERLGINHAWNAFYKDNLNEANHLFYLYLYDNTKHITVTNKRGKVKKYSRGEKIATLNFWEIWKKYND
jgi:hypothetical protein